VERTLINKTGIRAPFRKKLSPTSPTSGGRSVGIIRLQAKATEFVLVLHNLKEEEEEEEEEEDKDDLWHKTATVYA
jgi:hypothetical protein